MKKIVFICYANITRSPACRTVLKQMLVDRGIDDVDVDSAGIASFDGEEPDHWMVEAAMDRRYIIGGRSKHVTSELVKDADLVICMEHVHVWYIQKIMPYEDWSRIRLFNKICFGEDTDLADPTGQVRSATWECLDRIEAGCRKLVEMIKNADLLDTFRSLGYNLVLDKSGLYEFEELGLPFTVFVSDDNKVFSISQYVTGTDSKELTKEAFNLALDVTKDSYPDYIGMKSKGRFVFASPMYKVEDYVNDSVHLKNVIDEFIEAWNCMTFECCFWTEIRIKNINK